MPPPHKTPSAVTVYFVKESSDQQPDDHMNLAFHVILHSNNIQYISHQSFVYFHFIILEMY